MMETGLSDDCWKGFLQIPKTLVNLETWPKVARLREVLILFSANVGFRKFWMVKIGDEGNVPPGSYFFANSLDLYFPHFAK
jgi:hypothetical protein